MDQQRIKTLIDLMSASDLVELKFSENGSTLQLLRETSAESASEGRVQQHTAPTTSVTPLATETTLPGAQTQAAPFYGVLHLTPEPGKPQYAQPGDHIEQGQTLGLLEAMKMFHPLLAEYSGTLDAILVGAGEEVESGQPLFRITPAR